MKPTQDQIDRCRSELKTTDPVRPTCAYPAGHGGDHGAGEWHWRDNGASWYGRAPWTRPATSPPHDAADRRTS